MEVISISSLPEMPEAEGEKGPSGDVWVKVISAQRFPSGGPISSVKHGNMEMHIPFVFFNQVLPKCLGKIAPKEDVVLVLSDKRL